MSGLEFEEYNSGGPLKSRVILGKPATSKVVEFLVKQGIVKNERQAVNSLFIVSILFLTAAIAIFYFKVYATGNNALNTVDPMTRLESGKTVEDVLRERNAHSDQPIIQVQ